MMDELHLRDYSPDYKIRIAEEINNIAIFIDFEPAEHEYMHQCALLPKEEVPKLFKWLLQWLVENYK